MLLLVYIAIYSLYAASSMAILWVVAKVIWKISIRGSVVLFLAGWLLVLTAILSIGVLVGGIAKNSKSASVIASLLYFPMLVFSGATLPYEVMPEMMQKVVDVLPLTQGIKILKAAVLGEPVNQVTLSIVIMVLISLICNVIAIKYFKWE